MLDTSKLTPTERRIVNFLLDGINHTVKELFSCLYDVEGAEYLTVRVHIHNINKKILPAHEIVCIKPGGKLPKGLNVLYRLVRNIAISE